MLWLADSPVDLEDSVLESLSFYLAEHKDQLSLLLRGNSLESLKAGDEEKSAPKKVKVAIDNAA